MEYQKIAHAIRSQGCAAEYADEPPDHGKHMSNGQVLDIHKSGARARPKHY